ncbi:MAG: DNA-3-methyladenine glycosylase [Phycisphaeraceae bacterium]|nr:DNA-3-methyladenine glycosylase [Phycisphaeraceae bacterium]
MPERLDRKFFARGAIELAAELIGRRLVRVLPRGDRLSGVIVETEAYVGVQDRASHAYGGRCTPRNRSMYGPPGTAYVYFTYGMHHCMNVVCGKEGEPAAVLIRAAKPIEGLGHMQVLRGRGTIEPTELCSGPGKLCQAMQIDRTLDGIDLVNSSELFLEIEGEGPISAIGITRGPRIGLGDVGSWAKRRLRWYVSDSPYVSGGSRKRSPFRGGRNRG